MALRESLARWILAPLLKAFARWNSHSAPTTFVVAARRWFSTKQVIIKCAVYQENLLKTRVAHHLPIVASPSTVRKVFARNMASAPVMPIASTPTMSIQSLNVSDPFRVIRIVVSADEHAAIQTVRRTNPKWNVLHQRVPH